jgi:hypothetical protein
MAKKIDVSFEGFVQIRLATDPDPSDEPRGVSGWTFAVAGERDLDRVLVLQEDSPRRVARPRGPKVGVTVRKVSVDGAAADKHPLVGARVDLVGDPVFEGRNWILAEDATEPIDPFDLEIESDKVRIRRPDHILDAAGHVVPMYLADPALWQRRRPVERTPKQEVLDAIGVKDAVKWRQQRRVDLEADLAAATNATAKAALEKRIADLKAMSTPNDVAVALVDYGMRYRFDINGRAEVDDPQKMIGGSVDTNATWPITFWVGGWDADALCAYMRGTLTLPLF